MDDPLNVSIPLTGVDTSIPLLPEADVVLQCKKSTVDPNKDKTGLNWNLTFGTTTVLKSVDGKDVKPDFPLFAVYALQARSDSTDTEAYKRQLGAAVDALFGTTKEDRPTLSAELIRSAVGKTVVAHVIIDEYQGNKNNKIKRLKAVQ